MKVFALGGAGQFGRYTAQKLIASDTVSEIVIAGRNLEPARRAASELGAKATAVQVDLRDEGRLASLASGCDLLVNTAGPEYTAVLPALRAAIRARVNYCDLCAYGPVTEQALALDAAAKGAGITAVLGIGLSGLSNLRMIHAARQFDEVEELRFCIFQVIPQYGATAKEGEGPEQILAQWRKAGHADASWQFMMRLVAGKVRIYRDGQWIDVDPLGNAVHVTLPEGDEVTAIPTANQEAITLPRSIPGVRSVCTLYSMFPPRLNELCCQLGRRIANGNLDESTAAFSVFESLVAHPEETLVVPKGGESGWVDWVEATGWRHGERVRYKGWPSPDWTGTAGPLAVAARKILQGEIRARGVLPPEACFDPVPFFAEVAAYADAKPVDGKFLKETFEILKA